MILNSFLPAIEFGKGRTVSIRDCGADMMHLWGYDRVSRVAPFWDSGGGSEKSAALTEQLTEARFLAAFCCAVYDKRDPLQVCTTAMQLLSEYFEYQPVHFSPVVFKMPSFSSGSGPEGQGVSDAPALVPPGMKRSLSYACGGGYLAIEQIVHLPKGHGSLRIRKAKAGRLDPSAEFLKSIAVCLDSALEKALELKRLEELSMRDGLTGLLNRRAFEELLDIEEGRRDAPLQSLIMIDIDNFKSINDRFGHPAGDQVITRVAEVIRGALRDADLATRYGGEEFAVLLPGTRERDALAVAERIRSRIVSLDFDFHDGGKVTVSLGVANRWLKEQCGLKELLVRADESLYRAKRSGRNTTVVHR
jgi:two-component system, cell cycle response regulator